MPSLSDREKTLVLAAAAVAIIVAVWIFVAEPLLSSWERKEARIEYLTGKKEMMLASLSVEKELLESYDKMSKTAAITGSPEKSSRLVLERAGALAKTNGITARGLTPMPLEHYDFYSKVSVRMEIECTIEQLARALYEIRSGDGSLQVSKMEIAPADRNSDVLRGYIELTATVLKNGGEANDEKAE